MVLPARSRLFVTSVSGYFSFFANMAISVFGIHWLSLCQEGKHVFEDSDYEFSLSSLAPSFGMLVSWLSCYRVTGLYVYLYQFVDLDWLASASCQERR